MKENLNITYLDAGDIAEIMALEKKVCIPLIQASEETILKRFARGNFMIGVRMNDALVGSLGFRYGNFSLDNRDEFTKNFREFSTPHEKPSTYNAGFIYSVNVDPEHRTLAVHKGCAKGLRATGIGKALFVNAIKKMREDKCDFLVGDGRPTFYNGSHDFPHERYDQAPHLKDLLDKCAAGHELTPGEGAEIMEYPIFRAYNKFVGGGFEVAWVIPGFFPSDTPTGGFRVILYKRLT